MYHLWPYLQQDMSNSSAQILSYFYVAEKYLDIVDAVVTDDPQKAARLGYSVELSEGLIYEITTCLIAHAPAFDQDLVSAERVVEVAVVPFLKLAKKVNAGYEADCNLASVGVDGVPNDMKVSSSSNLCIYRTVPSSSCAKMNRHSLDKGPVGVYNT